MRQAGATRRMALSFMRSLSVGLTDDWPVPAAPAMGIRSPWACGLGRAASPSASLGDQLPSRGSSGHRPGAQPMGCYAARLFAGHTHMTRTVPMTRCCRSLFAGAALALAAISAFAHDTWLHVADQQPGSGLLGLEMGSGSRYPKSEGAVPGSR